VLWDGKGWESKEAMVKDLETDAPKAMTGCVLWCGVVEVPAHDIQVLVEQVGTLFVPPSRVLVTRYAALFPGPCDIVLCAQVLVPSVLVFLAAVFIIVVCVCVLFVCSIVIDCHY
jgi:hypothetical protein